MIPKNLFLLWIGKKPAFLDNVIDAYKVTNPDFNIREYIFEFDELEKQDDICIKNTLSYID